MSKYLLHGKYLAEGAKGLLKEGGSGRRDAIEKLIASQGGSVEGIYYAFGDTDIYVIADLPDNASAAAITLTIGTGGVTTAKATVLLTPEELDEAAKKTPIYRTPGQ